jgi:DNA polymerase-3 subunit epsilon
LKLAAKRLNDQVMSREIVLDTETTGLDPKTGHRLVEIGCIELLDYLPTGRTFHRYIHPEREIDPEAERVHGISLSFLADKPKFHHPDVCDALLEFIGDADLIAHNAPFDRGFVNHELKRINKPIVADSRWIDTLPLAQKKFPGMYNSLDALCKRFKISLADRTKHGALIDAQLLAGVYLELRGGKERGLDLTPQTQKKAEIEVGVAVVSHGPRPRQLALRSTDAERAAHEAFVRATLKGGAVWGRYGIAPE